MAENKHVKKSKLKTMVYVLYALCAALFVADFLIDRHGYHAWENYPVFYPVFAVLSCVIILALSKVLQKFLTRDEEYYEQKSGGEER